MLMAQKYPVFTMCLLIVTQCHDSIAEPIWSTVQIRSYIVSSSFNFSAPVRRVLISTLLSDSDKQCNIISRYSSFNARNFLQTFFFFLVFSTFAIIVCTFNLYIWTQYSLYTFEQPLHIDDGTAKAFSLLLIGREWSTLLMVLLLDKSLAVTIIYSIFLRGAHQSCNLL